MGNTIRVSSTFVAIAIGSGICSCGARYQDPFQEGINGLQGDAGNDTEALTSDSFGPAPTHVSTSPTGVPTADDCSTEPVRPVVPGWDVPTPPQACGVEGDVSPTPQTAQQVSDRVIGRWVVCASEAYSGRPNQWFGQQHDALEFSADGRWRVLKYDAAGELQAVANSVEGNWSVDTYGPGDHRLSFSDDHGGGVAGSFALQTGPSGLRITTMETLNTYVAVSEVAVDYSAALEAQAPLSAEELAEQQADNAERCGERGEWAPVLGGQDFTDRLAHRWLYCSGEYMYGLPHDGVEFRNDGTWAFLRYAADGELVARKGFDGGGTWELTGVDDRIQLDVASSRGFHYLSPLFWQDPAALRLVDQSEYVLAE